MQGLSILVFGAAGGIGSAVTRLCVAHGAKLTLAGRTQASLEALQAELPAGSSMVHTADACAFDQAEAACQAALTAYGRLDGVVCSVGSILLKPAHLTTEAEWATTWALNATAAFATVRAAAKTMKDGGSIVLFSSGAAEVGLPNHEAIAASKAAVEGLTRSAAATYAARGLRINAIAPGLVRTNLASKLTSSPQALQASTALHAAGRIGEPDEVARLAAFVLDPSNSWITGSVLRVDGGLSRVRARG